MPDRILELLNDFPRQIQGAASMETPHIPRGSINKIIVCGMGGSAIAGELLRDYFDGLPVFVVKNYDVPDFADGNTLAFVISYSGNTEETLSAYGQLKERRCHTVCLASGGRLAEADRNCILVPSGMPPRAALAYLFLPVLRTLENSGIMGNQSDAIQEAAELCKAFDTKPVQRMAKEMKGRVPVIYAGAAYSAVVYRWKTQINENAKAFALQNIFPELNHNELSAFINSQKQGSFHAIVLHDDSYPNRLKKRIKFTEEAIHTAGNEITRIELKGRTKLARIFYAIYAGDWLSYFLAKEYGTDPLDISLQEGIKKKLAGED